MIVRLMVVEDEPLALVAVIVYIVGVNCKVVGVPLITPLLKVRPLGKLGEIDHVVGAPMIPFAALLTWYNPVMPLVLIDVKYNSPSTSIKFPGLVPSLPERMSLTRTVPTAVPSVRHNALPVIPLSALK